MELDAAAALGRDALHDELRGRDHHFARITGFTVPWSTPDARDAVVGKPAVVELGLNDLHEALDLVRVHERPSGRRWPYMPDSPES
jgi:hypothetical protein